MTASHRQKIAMTMRIALDPVLKKDTAIINECSCFNSNKKQMPCTSERIVLGLEWMMVFSQQCRLSSLMVHTSII